MSKWNNYTNFSLVYNSTQVNNTSLRSRHESEWHEMIRYILLALEVSLVVVGASGSGVVLLEFFKRRKHDKNPSKTLLFHLCLADFLVILTTAVNCVLKNMRMTGTCPYSFACFILTRYASVFMMVILSFERYRSFTKPFERKMKNSEVLRYIFVSWSVTVVISLPQFITSLKLGPSGCIPGHFDHISRAIYFVWLFLSQYIIPLVAVAVLNIRTFRYLKNNTLNCSKGGSQKSRSIVTRSGSHRMTNCKVFRTLMYMILNFALCMISQHIIAIYFEFQLATNSNNREVYSILAQATFFDAVLVNAVANTFLYGAVYRKFRFLAFWRHFCCAKVQTHNGTAPVELEDKTTPRSRHFEGLSANSSALNESALKLQENKQECEDKSTTNVTECCGHSLSSDAIETAVSVDRSDSPKDTHL